MFFALTDDERDFGAAVRSYLAERFDLDAVRGVVDDSPGDGNPASLWKAMSEQGWLAVLVPEEHDGLGLGMVTAQVIARELGAGVAPGPWRGTVLAAEAIRLAGSLDQQTAWLPRLAAGDAVGAIALRGDPDSGWSGVEYAEIADVIVTVSGAAGGAGAGLRLLDPSTVQLTRQTCYDGTTRLAHVPASGSTGTDLPRASMEVLTELTARAAVLVAADLAGIAREAITRTVAYDRERTQFGVPVGSFQAIKHNLADLHVAVSMAEHAVLYAAHALDTAAGRESDTAAGRESDTAAGRESDTAAGRESDTALAVAVAKAKAGDAALLATAAMIQYHGGIGYTWEHEAHLFYKRAKRLAGAYGDADAQRERIADLTIG